MLESKVQHRATIRPTLIGLAIIILLLGAQSGADSHEIDGDPIRSGDLTKEGALALSSRTDLASARADLGFDPNQSTIELLLEDAESRAGLLETGLLLTASERAQYDARMSMVDSMREPLMQANRLDGFSGARLEHIGDGIFHIYHTSSVAGQQVAALFQEKIPPSASVQFHSVTHSISELMQQQDRLWSLLYDSEKGALGVHAIGVDVAANKLIVELDSNISLTDRVSQHGLVSKIYSHMKRIDFDITFSELGTDSVCNHPDNCVNPMMAGIKITKGSQNGAACSLGFMVVDGADTQALTAGHCGWSGSTSWYHNGYGSSSFGSEIDDDAYFDIGRDGMLIQVPDNQGSNDVALCHDWGCIQITNYLTNSELYGGMPVSMMGQFSGLKTGTIKDTQYSWWSNTCGCQQYGFSATYTSSNGDSGGPVWRGNNAVGLHSGGSSSSYRRAVPIEYLLVYYDVDVRTS
ncbi:S1 family peptidase [Candidatus Poriferisocius sp.]|uniref:S1 family peptidase n=1 Tax=Candidatus Poriferisocius sp. TaxID=3101276 RepID=UPI003B5B839C